MKIVFVQTGGTIDKDYPQKTKGYAFEISEPAVERVLKKLNPAFLYVIKSFLKKDSLDITENDRIAILEFCNSLEEDKIIITHGTDTMVDTAKVLSTITDKTIIITGSMRPEKFSDSDAPINIGIAIGAINYINPGIYIAMHGNIYPWDKVKRDLKSSQFVEL